MVTGSRRGGRDRLLPGHVPALPLHPGVLFPTMLCGTTTQRCPKSGSSGVRQQSRVAYKPVLILNTVPNKMNTTFFTFGFPSVARLTLSKDETLLNLGLHRG